MEKINRKKTLILIVTCFLLFTSLSYSTAEPIYNKSKTHEIKNLNIYPNKIPLLLPRYTLKENDEGPHQNVIFEMKEWWYYCVYFNDEKSELKNWCVVISISLFPTAGTLKLNLYDDENKSYGGTYAKPRDAVYAIGPGVNISFDNSFMIGRYPNWHVYAEYKKQDELEVTVNLTFLANSLPMWIIKNTGHNRSNSFFGYYCVMDCSVHGNVSLNGTIYNVSGIGYHDHPWFPLNLQKLKFNYGGNRNNMKIINLINYDVWDWLCIHFENGWDMFVGKIYLKERYLASKFGPGSLCFTQSGIKLYECYFFLLDYEEFKNSSIPNIKIPIKIHIKALILNTMGLKQLKGPILLDFYYEANNIQGELSGDPPYWVLWQSQGKTYGFAKSLWKRISLDGWAIMETTSYI